MDEIERLRIEAACARIVTEYCHFTDHGEASRCVPLFTEDAVWSSEYFGLHMNGRKEIERNFKGREELKIRKSRHVCCNLLVDVIDADNARGVVYFTLFRHDDEQMRSVRPTLTPFCVGEYRDEFVRTKDGWRIRRREAVVDFAAPL